MARVDVRTDISGTVISIVAKQDESVAEGDIIALVEAMKMEIPVVSPVNGKVVQISICEGDVIAENAVVAIVQV